MTLDKGSKKLEKLGVKVVAMKPEADYPKHGSDLSAV